MRPRSLRYTLRVYIVRYEWDERKNERNQKKHRGISFELAALVFEDDRCLIGWDRVDESGEQRWHAIGAVQITPEQPAVLCVVHAHGENDHGGEVIHIVPARRAEKREIRRYQDQAVD